MVDWSRVITILSIPTVLYVGIFHVEYRKEDDFMTDVFLNFLILGTKVGKKKIQRNFLKHVKRRKRNGREKQEIKFSKYI